MEEEITISLVTHKDMQQVLSYVIGFRKVLFPMLDPLKPSFDLLDFEYYYIEKGVFLQAKDSFGNLIGVVGLMPFKDRFDYLNYKDKKAFEIARLFVEPNYRRKGIAKRLVKALIEQGKVKTAQVLYLHTHPFLSGAQEFWHSQGFKHFKTTKDGCFTTIHMQLVF